MIRIRWTPTAAADLDHIGAYLSEHLPHFRQATLKKLYSRIGSLRKFPHLGRMGREEGTRELFFPPLPYIAVYRIRDNHIEVLRIYHGRQDRR